MERLSSPLLSTRKHNLANYKELAVRSIPQEGIAREVLSTLSAIFPCLRNDDDDDDDDDAGGDDDGDDDDDAHRVNKPSMVLKSSTLNCFSPSRAAARPFESKPLLMWCTLSALKSNTQRKVGAVTTLQKHISTQTLKVNEKQAF